MKQPLTGQALKDFVNNGGLLGVKSAAKKRIVKENKVTELSVHNQICKYLKLQYPDILFISDFAAGLKMSIGMASRQNIQKSNHSFPDIMIFEPRHGYYGLFLEVKRDRSALYLVDGVTYIKSEHVMAQIECLRLLNNKGYFAKFVCGFEESKEVVDRYLLTK